MKKVITMMKSVSVAVVVIGTLFSITGCNTMKGAGKDVQVVGEKVQDAAK